MGSSFRAAAAFVAFFAAIPLHAQQPTKAETLPDRLTASTALSSLDDEGLQPWHLKLDVTIFDDKGQNPVTGTIESWHAGRDQRTVFIFGSATRTLLRSGGKGYASHTGSDVPALADMVIDEYLRPGPREYEIKNGKLELHKHSFGNVQLDCVTSSHSTTYTVAPLGLFPTYCLDPGSDILRSTYSFGEPTVIRDSIGTFQGKKVSTDLILTEGTVRVAEAKTTALQTFVAAPSEFQPDPSMKTPVVNPVVVSGAVMASHILNRVDVKYPLEAREAHISGTVVLRAMIGRDGHVLSLRPESGLEPTLVIAAISAVRHETFSPYLFNGEPTEVQTTITVNFNLN